MHHRERGRLKIGEPVEGGTRSGPIEVWWKASAKHRWRDQIVGGDGRPVAYRREEVAGQQGPGGLLEPESALPVVRDVGCWDEAQLLVSDVEELVADRPRGRSARSLRDTMTASGPCIIEPPVRRRGTDSSRRVRRLRRGRRRSSAGSSLRRPGRRRPRRAGTAGACRCGRARASPRITNWLKVNPAGGATSASRWTAGRCRGRSRRSGSTASVSGHGGSVTGGLVTIADDAERDVDACCVLGARRRPQEPPRCPAGMSRRNRVTDLGTVRPGASTVAGDAGEPAGSEPVGLGAESTACRWRPV